MKRIGKQDSAHPELAKGLCALLLLRTLAPIPIP